MPQQVSATVTPSVSPKFNNLSLQRDCRALKAPNPQIPTLKLSTEESSPRRMMRGYANSLGAILIGQPDKHWVDCFVDDYQFERLWNRPSIYLNGLHKFAGVITPDFSMHPGVPQGLNIYNCLRNRILAYYYQKNGLNIIPVASWCYPEDIGWCFDGLPWHSSIAISTNGYRRFPYSRQILRLGVDALQQQLEPSHLIVCGAPMNELEGFDNIIYYPSYSERWRKRVRDGK